MASSIRLHRQFETIGTATNVRVYGKRQVRVGHFVPLVSVRLHVTDRDMAAVVTEVENVSTVRVEQRLESEDESWEQLRYGNYTFETKY